MTTHQTKKRSRGLALRLGIPAAALVTATAGTTAAHGGQESAFGLAAYYGQRVTWSHCRQGPDDDQGTALDRAGARCARIKVPLDYTRPTGRTTEIALSRLPAADPAHRIGTLVLNHGGPAEPTLAMPLETGAYMGRGAARYDLIGVDPRFVGRSSPIDCGWPTGIWIRSPGPDRAAFDRQVAFQKDLADRCVRRHGDVLPYVTTRNTARDMDIVRAVLGERRISYLGYSYGAYLGAVYTQMFPGRTDRVVLDSAGDPRGWGSRPWRGSERVSEQALRAWASWAARRHDTYGLGESRRAVLATVQRIVEAASHQPLRVGSYDLDEHVVPYLITRGIGSDKDDNRAEFSATVRVLDKAARRIPVEPRPELAGLLGFVLDGASSRYGSPAAAITCGDRAAPRDPDVYWRDIQHNRIRHPLFGPITNNITPCAFWPAPPSEAPTRIANNAKALIVSATGDTATTYRGSRAMHHLLPNSRLLTLAGTIAHGVYGEYGNTCVDGKVNAYLESGRLPTGNPTCQK
ncbi:alpha/beta hydrolase [Streptomyces coeruleorubidus]|uniref:alpha/beta hydrolase n=1 Tax=Streptomyces coeruleorubidus TaxID=116188 RepID=UPI0036B7995C